jgi:hypothetical protein
LYEELFIFGKYNICSREDFLASSWKLSIAEFRMAEEKAFMHVSTMVHQG